jgi:hypothetical protein
MNNDNLIELIVTYAFIFTLTINNLFIVFLQIVIEPVYYEIFTKEISFFFYSFLGILLWFLVLLSIGNLTTKKDTLDSGASLKDKLINFFIRKNIKQTYINLKDKKIEYSVLLSIIGGFIGIFSLGNLYNKLYKRFMIQFSIGLTILILTMIMIHNYPLTLDVIDIFFYLTKYPFFAVTYVLYYILTVNDTYECALSIKNNSELPSLSKKEVLYMVSIPSGMFLITMEHIPSLLIFGDLTMSYGGMILLGVVIMGAIFLD